jgi:hypothetical protein
MLVGPSSMPETVMPETSRSRTDLDGVGHYKVRDGERFSKEQRRNQQRIQQGICHRNDASRRYRDAWRIAQL